MNLTCGHTTPQCRIIDGIVEPFDESVDCRRCFLYTTNAPINRVWGGDGNVLAIRDTVATVKPRMSFSQMKAKRSRCQQAKKKGLPCDEFQQSQPPGPPQPYIWSGVPIGKRHLIYHVYPIKGNVWRDRMRDLVRRWRLFDGGVKVIGVATDDTTDSIDAVRAEFPGDADMFEVRNDPDRWERTTHERLWERVLAVASDEDAVFRGHAKGVTREPGLPHHEWSDVCHAVCLDFPELVDQQLREFPITGPFRQLKQGRRREFFGHGCDFIYTGTFWWARAGSVRSRQWRNAPAHTHGIEAWPGLAFRSAESGCLFFEMQQSEKLDRPDVWSDRVRPEYVRWRRQQLGQHSLHVITPCSRPEMIGKSGESLALIREFRLHWHVVPSKGGTHGGPERSEGLETVTDPDDWVWFLDDDNAVHPGFGVALADAIRDHPDAAGFVFGQLDADDCDRLPPTTSPDRYKIDTAQFVFRRSAIGDVRWDNDGPEGDRRFFQSVAERNLGKVVAVPAYVTYWNKLR